MNKKLIAAAVSAAVMAPVAAQAADVTVYGRINNALDFRDVEGADSTTDVSSVSSRFGFKASSDLGNGLTATARYEFSTVTDKEQNNVNDLRIGTVGLSGSFGSVTVGNQWSAFYDTVGTHIDPTYTLGYYLYSSLAAGPYRASNTIKYSNTFGPVYLEADVRLNDLNEDGSVAEKINGGGGTGFGIGVSIAATDAVTIALAYDEEEGVGGAADIERTGFAVKASLGAFWGILGWHEAEAGSASVEQTQLWLGTKIGESNSLMIGLGNVEASFSTVEPSAVNLGFYHNMGGGMKLYYEGVLLDSDDTGNDFDRHLLGMRIDF